VFADIELETGNISVQALERAVTNKTRAVMPVHFAGQACDMDEIDRLAESRGIPVVEDAAHAVGASYKQRRVGSKTKAACWSFYPTKNITTGEGGMVLTDSDELAQRYRMVALHGMSKDAWNRFTDKGSWYYEIKYPGSKYNMTDIQAALGLHQIARLDEFIALRTRYAQRYSEAFRELTGAILPHVKSDRKSAWHLYVLRLGPDAKLNRDQLIGKLKEDYNIGTTVNFIPLPMHPYYRDKLGYRIDDFPNAKRFYQECVSLPLYPKMTDDDVDYVIDAVRKLLQ
jgi:dTDP-4-amino-4,6-dideoxygalactose transaminase